MVPFDFQPRTRIVFGPHQVQELGRLARELGGTRVMLVTDRGIVQAGHTSRAVRSLEAAGCELFVFDGVTENPTTATIDCALRLAREFRPQLLVGFGGGSSMDCAKGVNFLYTNGGRMQDYWGRDKAMHPMLPMIAVPTTAGTGSEAQSFALISDAETHVKMACGDKKAACRVAILDPTLTVTQPAKVTAVTGIDALAHALETWVTNCRTPISLAFAREAWRLLHAHFPQVLSEPENLEARGGMQVGACWAGFAIENSMLGAAHATANPLTAEYNVIHGQAIAIMLPHVIRLNGEEFEPWYRELTATTTGFGIPADGGSAALADFVTEMTSRAGLATRLSEVGVEAAKIPELATAAAKQWTLGYNPRKLDEAGLAALYRQAF